MNGAARASFQVRTGACRARDRCPHLHTPPRTTPTTVTTPVSFHAGHSLSLLWRLCPVASCPVLFLPSMSAASQSSSSSEPPHVSLSPSSTEPTSSQPVTEHAAQPLAQLSSEDKLRLHVQVLQQEITALKGRQDTELSSHPALPTFTEVHPLTPSPLEALPSGSAPISESSSTPSRDAFERLGQAVLCSQCGVLEAKVAGLTQHVEELQHSVATQTVRYTAASTSPHCQTLCRQPGHDCPSPLSLLCASQLQVSASQFESLQNAMTLLTVQMRVMNQRLSRIEAASDSSRDTTLVPSDRPCPASATGAVRSSEQPSVAVSAPPSSARSSSTSRSSWPQSLDHLDRGEVEARRYIAEHGVPDDKWITIVEDDPSTLTVHDNFDAAHRALRGHPRRFMTEARCNNRPHIR